MPLLKRRVTGALSRLCRYCIGGILIRRIAPDYLDRRCKKRRSGVGDDNLLEHDELVATGPACQPAAEGGEDTGQALISFIPSRAGRSGYRREPGITPTSGRQKVGPPSPPPPAG